MVNLEKLVLSAGSWVLEGHEVARWIREEEGRNGEGLAMDAEACLGLVPLFQSAAFRMSTVGDGSRNSSVGLAAYCEPKGLRMLREALAAHDECIGRLDAARQAVLAVRDLLRRRRDEWRAECASAQGDVEVGLAGCADGAEQVGGEVMDLWFRLHRLQMAAYEDRETIREAVAQWSRDRDHERAPYVDRNAALPRSAQAVEGGAR